jgi:hypothetical protein
MGIGESVMDTAKQTEEGESVNEEKRKLISRCSCKLPLDSVDAKTVYSRLRSS